MGNKSFVVWNNKGGVGKSTIVFHVATVYAQKNPERDVLVVDMCPQANSSMMLLGGSRQGEKAVSENISQNTPKSVVGYITDVIASNGADVALDDYLIACSSKNKSLTDNTYLLCGDGNLELVAPLISQRANVMPVSELDNPWVTNYTIIKNLMKKGINKGRDVTVFIDTNPAFSIYTGMAILSAEQLLVPINADDSSIYAIKGLFNLIWGATSKHPVYGNYTFASKVDKNELSRPVVHSLLGNRFTQKKGAAHAFKALSDEGTRQMYSEYLKNTDRFRTPSKDIASKEDFEEEYTFELRDFNSAGVVAANQGLPLNKMDSSRYEVYGEHIVVAKNQRDACREVVEGLVATL